MGGVRKFMHSFESAARCGKNGTLHPGLSQESSFSPFWSMRRLCGDGGSADKAFDWVLGGCGSCWKSQHVGAGERRTLKQVG